MTKNISDYDRKLWEYNDNRRGLFRLTYGIYHPKRPDTSKDSKKYLFKSYEDAMDFLKEKQKLHAELGYQTWIAYLDKPNSETEYFN